MGISQDEVRRDKVIKKADYRMSAIVAQVVAGIILLVVGAYMISYSIEPIKSGYWTNARDIEISIKNIFKILGFVWCILSVAVFIKVPAMKKSFVCVTKSGVYGSGGKAFYFASQPFTIPIDQITNVYTKGNSVYIGYGGFNYRCIVDDPEGVVCYIKSPEQNQKVKSDSSYMSQGVKCYGIKNSAGNTINRFSWTCGKCGISNNSESNICSICGKQKE